MREYCPDNLSVWQAHECHEAKQEAWEEKHLPVCEICGKKLEGEDEWLDIEGYHYHRDCFVNEYTISKDQYFSRFR